MGPCRCLSARASGGQSRQPGDPERFPTLARQNELAVTVGCHTLPAGEQRSLDLKLRPNEHWTMLFICNSGSVVTLIHTRYEYGQIN